MGDDVDVYQRRVSSAKGRLFAISPWMAAVVAILCGKFRMCLAVVFTCKTKNRVVANCAYWVCGVCARPWNVFGYSVGGIAFSCGDIVRNNAAHTI